MRQLLGFVAAAVVATALAACGDSSGPVGTWTIDASRLKEEIRAKMGAQAGAGARAEGMPRMDEMVDQLFSQLAKADVSITLESGGSASFSMRSGDKTETGKGTWKQDGEKITFTETEKNGKPTSGGGDSPAMTFRGGSLFMDQGGFAVPFRRK